MSDASSASPTPPAVSPRSAMLIVFLVVFIDLLGFGIVLPLLPLYGKTYVSQILHTDQENYRVGAIVGLLMASFSAMQFIFAPIWGRVSDRIGRRPILLMGLFGSVIFYALFGYASDIPAEGGQAAFALALIFVARIGAGIAGATIGTAQAVIADCTAPEKRKHGMALIGAAFGIGFTFGPLIAYGSLQFAHASNGTIGYVAAGLSFLALVLGLILLPETRRFSDAPPLQRDWLDFRAIRNVFTNPAIAPVVLVFFLASLGFGSFEVTLSLLNADALKLTKDSNFLVFAWVGFTLLMAQGFLYRRLANRVSEPTFMLAGIICMGMGVLGLGGVNYLATPSPDDLTMLKCLTVLCLTIAVVGFALLTPSAQALVSRRSDPERQGEILGVNQSASALARILGPIYGLTLYTATKDHMLPYLLGGALVLAMLPLIPRIRRGG